MEVFVDRAAGIDVHKKTLTVCVVTTKGRKVAKTLKRFGAFNRELVMLRDWLRAMGVSHVAMEATGEYWKPVYEVLEGSFELVLANAQHVKNVPGRKTDPEDASWLARLLRHGLLTPSFVPTSSIRDLRDLTRMRRKMIQSRAQVENRAQKVLEAAGIKIGSVMTDVFGITGHAILRDLAQNKLDPKMLAEHAKGSLKDKKQELAQALESTFSNHDAELLKHQLLLHDELSKRIASIHDQIATLATPYEKLIQQLDSMPGITPETAIEIISEIGTDMSPWPDCSHMAAWAGLCPGNHESAGKRRNIGVRKGNIFLKSLLVQAANAAAKANGTYYQAKFLRICKRRGYKRAVVAVAHAMLRAIFAIIRTGTPYREPLRAAPQEQSSRTAERSLVKRLEQLGYVVRLEKA